MTDPKVPKQCTLLVSVGWKQGEHGKVTGKELENSGIESLEFYLRALIPFYGLVLRKKSSSAILHAVFKFLAGNDCLLFPASMAEL